MMEKSFVKWALDLYFTLVIAVYSVLFYKPWLYD